MKYNPELGIFGNIQKLYRRGNEQDNTIANNKVDADENFLFCLASDIEAVEDEFNAITEE